MKRELVADISESGEIKFRHRDALQAAKDFFKGKTVLVVIDLLKRKRSLQQNRLYWKYLQLLSVHTGYTTEQLHDMFRGLFLFESVIIGKTEFRNLLSTTEQVTGDMSHYIENIREWQRDNLPECYLPTAQEFEEWERAEYTNKGADNEK